MRILLVEDERLLSAAIMKLYQMQTRPGGAILVVIDARSELANIRTLLLETVAVTALAFVLLAVGAALLIGRMLHPVEEAFVKQRQFVWNASHELKTPLAVISANADVLADEIGGNEYLGYIRSEVTRTNTFVENLLTLARMDSGTRKKQTVGFDLSRALLSVALPFESAVFEAGKTLEIDVPQGGEQDGQQPPEKPDGDADDDSADQPELPEIGGVLEEVQLKNLLDAGVITQEQYDAIVVLLGSSENAA